MITRNLLFVRTDNSLYVAKKLEKQIPEAELIPMVSLLNEDVVETLRKL